MSKPAVTATVAVVVCTLGSFLLAGCGLLGGAKNCTAVYKSSLNLSYENESGTEVNPERVVVTHEDSGEQKTRISSCTPQGDRFGERGGTFTIRGECGDEVVTRQVEVTSGECHVDTKSVTLTFPDGACTMCADG
ncbi:MAG: hypothetical protein ABEN55_17270 [Bradymonadaceae bacterium]